MRLSFVTFYLGIKATALWRINERAETVLTGRVASFSDVSALALWRIRICTATLVAAGDGDRLGDEVMFHVHQRCLSQQGDRIKGSAGLHSGGCEGHHQEKHHSYHHLLVQTNPLSPSLYLTQCLYVFKGWVDCEGL